MADAATEFMAVVDQLTLKVPELSAVKAALLAAAHFGVASDSRSFARELGVAHALALRELNALAEDGDLLRITKRDPRTLRTWFAKGEDAKPLFA